MTGRSASVGLALAALLCGCDGSSGSDSSSKAPGGAIGAIDRARVVSVCEDIRQASTTLSTGDPEPGTHSVLLAAADALDRPPHVDSADTLAAKIRADVQRSDGSAAVDAGLAWCRANGG